MGWVVGLVCALSLAGLVWVGVGFAGLGSVVLGSCLIA